MKQPTTCVICGNEEGTTLIRGVALQAGVGNLHTEYVELIVGNACISTMAQNQQRIVESNKLGTLQT
jgi:hypothetical protein